MSPEYKKLKIPVYKTEKELQRSGQGGTRKRYVMVLIRHVSKFGAYEIIAKLSSLIPRSGNYLYKRHPDSYPL